jgi:hypothetical protein
MSLSEWTRQRNREIRLRQGLDPDRITDPNILDNCARVLWKAAARAHPVAKEEAHVRSSRRTPR